MPRKDFVDTGELTDPAFYILLSLVNEKHGYIIMKSIERITKGNVIIGAATLYTTLRKLLEWNLIELVSTEFDSKKVYKITQKGIEILLNDIERKKNMIDLANATLIAERKEVLVRV